MYDQERPYEQMVNHIKCTADDCRYHDADDCCTASCIEVCGCGSDCADTDPACETFSRL